MNDSAAYVPQGISHTSTSDLMQWVLQNNDILNNVRHFLEGVMPVVKDNELVFERVSEPLMNRNGISVTLMMIQSANKQAIMSDLDDPTIREVVGDFNDDYIDTMAVCTNRYRNEWGVDPSKRSLIVTMVVNQLRVALLMAQGGRFIQAVNTMEQVQRQIIDQPEKKMTFFGRKI